MRDHKSTKLWVGLIWKISIRTSSLFRFNHSEQINRGWSRSAVTIIHSSSFNRSTRYIFIKRAKPSNSSERVEVHTGLAPMSLVGWATRKCDNGFNRIRRFHVLISRISQRGSAYTLAPLQSEESELLVICIIGGAQRLRLCWRGGHWSSEFRHHRAVTRWVIRHLTSPIEAGWHGCCWHCQLSITVFIEFIILVHHDKYIIQLFGISQLYVSILSVVADIKSSWYSIIRFLWVHCCPCFIVNLHADEKWLFMAPVTIVNRQVTVAPCAACSKVTCDPVLSNQPCA